MMWLPVGASWKHTGAESFFSAVGADADVEDAGVAAGAADAGDGDVLRCGAHALARSATTRATANRIIRWVCHSPQRFASPIPPSRARPSAFVVVRRSFTLRRRRKGTWLLPEGELQYVEFVLEGARFD